MNNLLNKEKTSSIEFNAEQYKLNRIVNHLHMILKLFIDNDRKAFLEEMALEHGYKSFGSYISRMVLHLENLSHLLYCLKWEYGGHT
jgi:hypothetical protein